MRTSGRNGVTSDAHSTNFQPPFFQLDSSLYIFFGRGDKMICDQSVSRATLRLWAGCFVYFAVCMFSTGSCPSLSSYDSTVFPVMLFPAQHA